MTDPSLGDLAATAGALFTALAAWAALRTARQGKQVIEAAERPLLEAQVFHDSSTGTLSLSILNAGRGIARGANFVVHANGQLTDNILFEGFVKPGEAAAVSTSIPLDPPPGVIRADLDDLAVMVAYRDAEGFVHYRTHEEKEYVPRTKVRRRPAYPDRVDVFKHLYPEVDVDAAVRARNQVRQS